MKTIVDNPHLFRVSTEINVDHLEHMLVSHPNQEFVHSVCTMLREGAWPHADTKWDAGYPLTWDNSKTCPKSEEERDFIESQCLTEENAGHYSAPFGPDLLPGMYSTPVFAIPKRDSDELRLCSHMSAGTYCQNSMMDRVQTKGARLDTMHNFIPALLRYRRKFPKTELILFKSDVAGAFRLIPTTPVWQIKQVVTSNYPTKFDIEAGRDRGPLIRHVDQRDCFGSCASPRDWASVMGLVLWIAIFVKLLPDIFAYVDDNWGFEEAGNLEYYAPYEKFMPAKQVALLSLWDELGIPHKERKQLWGAVLTIIGFSVDINAMTITLPDESKSDLMAAVEEFVKTPRRHRPLHEWQQLSGWISWSLNVFPLLRPALCHVYLKTAEKGNKWGSVYLNNAVKEDLTWFLRHVRQSAGVFLFRTIDWHPLDDLDFEI
jgi:hypothetical protein